MLKAQRLMELQAIIKEIKPEIDALKSDLLKVTQDLGVLTLKTEKYTISRAKRITPQVVDQKALKKALDEQEIPYQMVEAFAPFMTTVFREAIEQGKELDGLEALETEYITVRIKEDNENIG